MPLLVNESMWALGMTFMNNIYSTRSLDVVNALNINSTLYNMSGVVYLAMGSAVGIIIGQMLGEGKSAEEVKDADRKLIVVSVFSCLVFSGLMVALSTPFPAIYETSDSIKALATKFICIGAFMMPFHSYTHAAYFTLRSGGQTFVTFLFDCCFVWALCVPCAYLLVKFTTLGIVAIYLICQMLDIIKCGIGAILLYKGVWIRNIVSNEQT
jgi:Na+-driven multidrug efflux pump